LELRGFERSGYNDGVPDGTTVVDRAGLEAVRPKGEPAMSSTTIPSTPDTPDTLAGVADQPPAQWFEDLYRMTVYEYERLADAGVLQDRRVELINGLLVKKMTAKPPHVVAVDATREAIAAQLPTGWWLREEKPVRIPDFDEPEPDVSVVRGSRQDYQARHPGPADIAFLVEVADTSLPWDRGEKLSAYARARVPTYWILNLVDRQLEVYTDPEPTGYRHRLVLAQGDSATLVLDRVEFGTVAVADLLP
jgi:Uma2 family endonuclease